MVPLFARVNFVLPELLAVKISPLPRSLILNADCPPAFAVTLTFPIAFGERVKFPLFPVLIARLPLSAILFAENV